MTTAMVVGTSWHRSFLFANCLIFFLAISASSDAAPVIGRIMPPAGQRGTECEVTVTGSRLNEAIELFFEDDLVQQISLSQPNNGMVKLRLRIPKDCPLGDHRVRLRTKAGLSALRTFAIVSAPIRIEQETERKEKSANNTPDTAELIETSDGTTQAVAGIVRREDVDTYRLPLQAGEKISVSVRAVRLNHTPFDPALELLDDRGFVIASCDDHSLLQQDAMIAIRVKEAGDYFLRVRESAYRGDDNSVYLLQVGRFPAPTVALPPGGTAGQEMMVEWLGDCDGPWRTKITLPQNLLRREAVLDGIFYAVPVRESISAVEGVPLRMTSLSVSKEIEPNDTADAGQALPTPMAVWGQMQKPGDVDWLRFEAAKGSKWSVKAWGRRLGSPIDLILDAYRDDKKRQKITGNDDAGGPDSRIMVTVP